MSTEPNKTSCQALGLPVTPAPVGSPPMKPALPAGVETIPSSDILTSKVWQFGRSDGMVLAAKMRLLPGGRIEGATHPYASRWAVVGQELLFYDASGKVSTRYNSFKQDIGWTVAPLPGPSLALTPLSLANSCQSGQNAVSRTLKVWNTGGGSLSYTIASDAAWLSVNPGSGISTGEQDYLKVVFSTSGLAPGSYAANLTATATGSANSPQTIPVTLQVVFGTSQGIPKWTFQSQGNLTSSPALATDGTLYVLSGDGSLYAVNPDGTQRWSFTTDGGNSSPVIGRDGTVYVGAGDGTLYAIHSDCQGLASSPWPMFRQNPFHTARAPVAIFLPLVIKN